MELNWMGEYRDMVEKIIKYCNVYALVYNKETEKGSDVKFSFSQIQVVEYLLENEDLHQNMSEIATRLGIYPSAFSKLVNRLVQKGFLKKYHASDNRKDVIIKVTDFGREVYMKYSAFILENHFSKMFRVADEIPREYIARFAAMLDASITDTRCVPTDTPVVLIQIDSNDEPESK